MRQDDQVANVVPLKLASRGSPGKYEPHLVNLRVVCLKLEKALVGRYVLVDTGSITLAPVSPKEKKLPWAFLEELCLLVHNVQEVRLRNGDDSVFTFTTRGSDDEEYTYTAQLRKELFE